MADVFLSYAREDLESANRLAEAIRARGWSVWWDRRIRAGHAYEEVIEREIAAARCVVVLWTRHSVPSRWVCNEAREGLERGMLIPVRLEEVRPPLSFRHLQTGELREWTRADLDEILASIEEMIGAPARAVEASSAPEPPAVANTVEPAPAKKPSRWIVVAVAVGALAMAIYTVVSSVDKELPATDTAATDTSIAPVTRASFRSAPSDEIVDLETTAGRISIELFPAEAPNHVRAFLAMVRSSSIDGASAYFTSRYHGVAFWLPLTAPDFSSETNSVPIIRGTVVGAPSHRILTEFTVMTVDTQARGTAFGRVVEGMDVVHRLAASPTTKDLRPIQPITITKATIRSRTGS